MKIGILSKKTKGFGGMMKDYFERQGHQVSIYTQENLVLNNNLFKNDVYVQKSKTLFYLYAGYFLEENGIPVLPSPKITDHHKNRILVHEYLKNADLLFPQYFFGSLNAFRNNIEMLSFPLIKKPLTGSRSFGVTIINTIEDLEPYSNEMIYLEEYLEGTHYCVYFIKNNICQLEKPPLSSEHADMELVPTDPKVKKIIKKWINSFKGEIMFGHLDMVKETSSNRFYVVDPGSFPEFDNWKCKIDPLEEICEMLLGKFNKLVE
ncbi:MAG: Carbamoyl phosphate synthase-like protein [Promethearchaeota archaeon]|nr:MAG: Carbamoyl phosphate synthase-like protein [Candidatus Lokiarchaeota archaeon]